MATADSIASEMETAVIDDSSQFTQLFDRLTVLQDKIGSACSPDVQESFDLGIYKLALANAGYTGCEFYELCDKSKIERDLIRGTSLIDKALTTAETTA